MRIPDMSRRTFLKVSATAAAGLSVGLGTELISLKKLGAVEANQAAKMMEGVQKKYTACAMCPAECALEMWVKDNRVTKIYGNAHCPFNNGTACAKGASGLQLIYSPDRLKYPMIRTGARGEGKFKRVTWEEAIDFIAQKLTKIKGEFGAESIIMDAGDITDRDQYHRLFFAYGSPNCVEHGAICDTPRRHGPKLMFGGKRIEPDIMRPVLVRQKDGSLKYDSSHRAKLIIYLGWNPFVATRITYESRGTVAAQVENGCKVIVVDPAHTNTAAKADMWLPIRPGTDPDFFAAILRYILENDDQMRIDRRYIDWSFKKFSMGWDEFEAAFKSWWGKVDPINNLPYFSLEWAENRTGLSKAQIAEVAHMYGITKPAALVWGMQSPGHHYNGYVASIIGTVLNVITGNFDAPGGAIDTEITKSSKGGNATGKQFKKRKIKKVIDGKEVEGEVEHLHMDLFSDWPAAWDDVVGDYPRRFLEGVNIHYGPFKGHKYPIKAFFIRTGNPVITGSATWKWVEALTAKEGNDYKVPLVVSIDSLYLETGMYSDVILPEASYAERMSLSDIYPSHPLIFLRDAVIKPLHECKAPTDIMNMLAKRLVELGDKDLKASDFWDKYKSEENFVDEMLAGSPGTFNIGEPLPYPNLPEGYKIIGTPESLNEGRVKIDPVKKEVKGDPVTVKWLREHKGVAIWPMSWYRYRTFDKEKQEHVPNKVWPPTGSKTIEFEFKRYEQYNKLIDATGVIPIGLKAIGFERFPKTFYWFETKWNPYTNPKYAKYGKDYPFQLICGRVHHAMSGTQLVPWLAETPVEGLFMPLNKAFEYDIAEPDAKGQFQTNRRKFKAGTWCVGTLAMSVADAGKMNLKTGDLVELENPLGKKTKTKVFVTEGMRPGTVKMGFGTGGRFTPGMGGTYAQRDYTPNHNDLVDPDDLSPIMGMPTYADMIVKITKI
jgi:thiosulfate reductase/polysulfide reductase chain A